MKKIFGLLVFIASFQIAFGQTETFDILTYTPPNGWKKDAKEGVMNYTQVNASAGTFCVVSIFTSTASSGNAQSDFENEWNEKVVTLYKAESNPKTETQTTSSGWKAVVGAAPVKMDGVDVYIILTVFSGFGKTMAIRTSLNDQSYTTQVDALLESSTLDKTASATPANNNNNSTVATGGRPGKFGNMTYSTPAGWNEQQFTDGVVFKPTDLPTDEQLSIQIMQPLSYAGNLEQALQLSFDEAASMYKGTKMNYAGTGENYKKTEVKRSFNGWEYILGNGGIRIDNGSSYPPEFGLDLFVIKVNNRYERLAVLKSRTTKRSCSMSAFFPDERSAYSNAINNLFFSIRFTDGPSPLLQPGNINGGGILGVWQGISLSVGTPTTSQPLGVGYRTFNPIFLSNGQAYFGPKFYSEGLDGVDTRVLAERFRRDWGTYTFSNGTGVLRMPYGNIPLRMQGNTLIISPNNTDHKFSQLTPVDGARFNGTYKMTEAYGKIPWITFTSDGRFSDNGAIRTLYHEYSDCLNPAVTPGAGTYEVKNYTIHFNYSDGRNIKIAFLGTDFNKSNPSPATLRMSNDDTQLTRQ